MANRRTILSVAAQVWDQDSHSQADMDFLADITRADREWLDALNTANLTFGGGSEAWNAVKYIATRRRDDDYARALAALEAHDDEEEFAEAAE